MSGNLTWKKDNGEWGIEGVDLTALPPAAYGAIAKLKDIEHPMDLPTNGDRVRRMTDEALAGLPFCPYQHFGDIMPCEGRAEEVTEEACDKCALRFYQFPSEV